MITDKNDNILRFSSNPDKIKKLSMRVITTLQDYPRGDIIVALSVLWLMLCERYEVRHSDVLNIAETMRNKTFDDPRNAQFKALRDYMKDEL